MGGDPLWGLVLGFSQFNATEVTLLKQRCVRLVNVLLFCMSVEIFCHFLHNFLRQFGLL